MAAAPLRKSQGDRSLLQVGSARMGRLQLSHLLHYRQLIVSLRCCRMPAYSVLRSIASVRTPWHDVIDRLSEMEVSTHRFPAERAGN